MDARTVFAWTLLAVLTAIGWLLVRPFLSWLLLTGLLAFALYPLQQRLRTRIGGRAAAGTLTTLVVLVVAVPLAVGANALLADGAALLSGVSEAEMLRRFGRTIERVTGVSVPVRSLAERAVEWLSSAAQERASTVLGAGVHAAFGLLLLLFVLYYLLKDGERFVAWTRSVIPLAPPVRDELFESVNDMTWAVLKGHILVAAVQGFVAGISLFLTGVPYAFLLTAAMMVLAVVPIVGVSPVLGGAVLYLFLNGQQLAAAFVVVWGLTAVALTDDYLRAVLIDRESELHSAVVLVGLAGGTYLLGAMGLFVGPILAGLFKATVDVFADHYGVGRR